jgi:hypothetical protein
LRSGVSRAAPQPVVAPDQGTTGFATAGNNSSSSSSSSSQVLDARKNPELYSLTQERTKVAHHQQQQQQQQQQRQASVPWPLPSGQGSVGSTGAYSSEPQPYIQQLQQRQPGSSSNSSRPPLLRQRPEVLSPAGGWPQLRAAVENGADAVYFGVTGFNARAR